VSGGYRAGVRETRAGETPPMCWDCIACGIGEACFCAAPNRVRERCPDVEVITGYSDYGYMCSLPAGHAGAHEAWVLPEGGMFDARAECLTTWARSVSVSREAFTAGWDAAYEPPPDPTGARSPRDE